MAKAAADWTQESLFGESTPPARPPHKRAEVTTHRRAIRKLGVIVRGSEYATPMPSAASLLREARTAAGLSRKALALRAGMPTSTVSRVEDGLSSPTVDTLERVLAAAGRSLVLETTVRPEVPRLAGLSNAWNERHDDVDWTRVRAFVDHLHQHPEQIADAIAGRPRRSGHVQLDNLLAAIAERTADNHDLPRPRWTGTIPSLVEPWKSSGTPAMHRRERAAAPEQFVDRGIHLAASNVWRSRA